MSSFKVGLKEIAREVNYSINTVSRALRDCDDISNTTKSIIRQKALELGYFPNRASLKIKIENRPVIALVYREFNDHFFSTLSDKILNNLNDEEIVISIKRVHEEKLTRKCVKTLVTNGVDIILSFLDVSNDAIELVNLFKVHLLVVGKYSDSFNISCFFLDDEKAGILVGKYLVDNKYTSILFIGDKEPSTKKKYRGFERTIHKYQIEANIKSLIYPLNKNEFISILFREKIDAIYCVNNKIAFEVNSLLDNIINQKKALLIGNDSDGYNYENQISFPMISFDYSLMASEIKNVIIKLTNETKSLHYKIMFDVFLKTDF